MKQPFLIGIGGAHSGAGKTTIAVEVLKYLTSHSSPPHPPLGKEGQRGGRWGAIKYTKTAFYSSIIDDKSILMQENKDTCRLFNAGAEAVLWVQSPESELSEVLSIAMNRLSHLDGIIIEGNSAIEFLKPAVVIFIIASANNKRIKASAEKISRHADITIKRQNAEYITQINDSEHEHLTVNSKLNIEDLVKSIEMVAQQKKIKELLKQKSTEGCITCSDARKIAEDLGIAYIEVGKIANNLKIKIKDCKLGCF
jgi:LAO/AO transport system kinase